MMKRFSVRRYVNGLTTPPPPLAPWKTTLPCYPYDFPLIFRPSVHPSRQLYAVSSTEVQLGLGLRPVHSRHRPPPGQGGLSVTSFLLQLNMIDTAFLLHIAGIVARGLLPNALVPPSPSPSRPDLGERFVLDRGLVRLELPRRDPAGEQLVNLLERPALELGEEEEEEEGAGKVGARPEVAIFGALSYYTRFG